VHFEHDSFLLKPAYRTIGFLPKRIQAFLKFIVRVFTRRVKKCGEVKLSE